MKISGVYRERKTLKVPRQFDITDMLYVYRTKTLLHTQCELVKASSLHLKAWKPTMLPNILYNIGCSFFQYNDNTSFSML